MTKRLCWMAMVGILAMALLVPTIGCGGAEQPAGEHETVTVELYSSVAPTGSYQVCAAVADLINKNHPWIRVSHIESSGDLERVSLTVPMPPERRKNVLLDVSDYDTTCTNLGIEPFPKCEDLIYLSASRRVTLAFATLDPDIKTPQDFVGKKFASWPKGHLFGTISESLLRDVWGIADKVQVSNHPPPAFKDVLTTGVADFILMSNAVWGNKSFELEGVWMELVHARPTYMIGVSQADVDKFNAVNPQKLGFITVPKGAWLENLPQQDIGALTFEATWAVYKDMDDELAYELIKFLDEHAEQFGEYYHAAPGRISAERLYAPWLNENNTHPGSWKYFKEKGWVK